MENPELVNETLQSVFPEGVTFNEGVSVEQGVISIGINNEEQNIKIETNEITIINEMDNFEVPPLSGDTENLTQKEEISTEVPKRRIPKKILENQMKYMEALEKQQKMKNPSKNKTVCKKTVAEVDSVEPADKTGMIRMVVNGRVKYIPINKESESSEIIPVDTPLLKTKESAFVKENSMIQPQKLVPQGETPPLKTSGLIPSRETPPLKTSGLIPSRETTRKSNQDKPHNRMPERYAKQIEKDVKKTTIQNVKSFSDLRRIKAMEDLQIDTNVDINKVSMNELRRMKMEQKKKDILSDKNKQSKRESAVQNIMSDEKMSKFSKMIAVNNLAVNSRHKKSIAISV